jgi:nucleoside-diphosphate-sugar epimerase
MKLIVTGATGLIGGATLNHALNHPAVTSIIVLSRRDIGIQHPKLKTIIKKDYLAYTTAELQELGGAEACIWSLGAPSGGLEVHVQYPRAALQAFSSTLATTEKPFTFVLLSGAIVVRDQARWLPPGLSALKARGRVEIEFVEHEAQHKDTWKTFVARPSMVLQPGTWQASVYPAGFQITVPTLAAALVDAAVNSGDVQTLDNAALKAKGERAIAALARS